MQAIIFVCLSDLIEQHKNYVTECVKLNIIDAEISQEILKFYRKSKSFSLIYFIIKQIFESVKSK